MTTAKTILQELESHHIDRVKIGGFDIDGILRGKFVSRDKFESALENGLGFCDVIFGWDCADQLYDNSRVTGWHTGYPDVLARIELDSMRLVPWEEQTALFLVDYYTQDGQPLEVSPQQALKRVVAQSRQLGYEPVASAEFEFFFFSEGAHSVREKAFRNLRPLSPGMFGYSVLRASMFTDLVRQIIEGMDAYRCPVEGIHTETGPGVYEAALRYSRALTAAQQAALFKTGIKEIANRHGLIATFMAKWSEDFPGCSGHLHQSLWSPDLSQNLFAGDSDEAMSPLMRQYLAGQLATMRELMPFYAPTVNSYKRLVEGTWAPTAVSWGHENRTAAVRVITGPSSKATRCEVRVPGADINPFLAMAASIAGGLHGIEQGLELGRPVQGNAYSDDDLPPLPRSLAEAITYLDRSEVARHYLGDELVDHFLRTRQWEVRQYNRAVTQWELDRYFEVI